MLKKKINFRRVEQKLIDGRVDKLRLEAKNIETGVVNRTLSGKDVKKKGFKPYSKAYAKRKGDSKVTLSDKGNMLGAITSKNIANGIRFFFSTSSETKKAYWNNKIRKFFGVDKDQIKYLKKRIGKL